MKDGYYSGPCSKNAIENADKNGLVVVFPGDGDIQVDIDNDWDFGRFERQMPILCEHETVLQVQNNPSRSGDPQRRHITVTIARSLTNTERVLLQAALGSDLKRELLGYIQIVNKDPHPVFFLEMKGKC